jgi:hypothetical protein
LATLLGDGRIDEERREHMQMYNWLGDPTLKLGHPQAVEIDDPGRIESGQKVVITGTAPMSGALTIELHRRLGTVPTKQAVSSATNGDSTPLARYRQANDTAIASTQVLTSDAGRWTAELDVPPDASGPMRIVVDLESAGGFGTGVQTVWVRPPTTSARK